MPREKELEPSEVQTRFKPPLPKRPQPIWKKTHAPDPLTPGWGIKVLQVGKADQPRSGGSIELGCFRAKLSYSQPGPTEGGRLEERREPGQEFCSAPVEATSFLKQNGSKQVPQEMTRGPESELHSRPWQGLQNSKEPGQPRWVGGGALCRFNLIPNLPTACTSLSLLCSCSIPKCPSTLWPLAQGNWDHRWAGVYAQTAFHVDNPTTGAQLKRPSDEYNRDCQSQILSLVWKRRSIT